MLGVVVMPLGILSPGLQSPDVAMIVSHEMLYVPTIKKDSKKSYYLYSNYIPSSTSTPLRLCQPWKSCKVVMLGVVASQLPLPRGCQNSQTQIPAVKMVKI